MLIDLLRFIYKVFIIIKTYLFFYFLAVLKAAEKKDYMKDSTDRFARCLLSCTTDPFFNLKSGKETPGNLTVKLARKLLDVEKSNFDSMAKQFSVWFFPALNLPGSSDAREQACRLFIKEVILETSNHEVWKLFLSNTKIGKKEFPYLMI